MTELGDSINGAEIGRAASSTYYWVRCPVNESVKCLGDRWTVVSHGSYDRQDPDAKRIRTCKHCDNARKRTGFKLSPKRMPTRPMN